jgi:guanylate cyclase
METYGQTGAIQVTRSTYDLIKDDFILESKGKITVRGAGEVDVWHVLRSKSESA